MGSLIYGAIRMRKFNYPTYISEGIAGDISVITSTLSPKNIDNLAALLERFYFEGWTVGYKLGSKDKLDDIWGNYNHDNLE